MASRIRVFVQYVFILAITAFLVWFSLRAIQVEEGENKGDYILKTLYSANKLWLLLMLVFVMISHALRAERWRMLLYSTGHTVSFYNGFLSLMVGYLVNLVIPRGGEVSRCYNLYRLNKIPVEVSFGTVVLERIVDLILLVVVLVFAFVAEYDKLLGFIETLPLQPVMGKGKLSLILMVMLVLLIITGVGYWLIKRNQKIKDRLQKVWKGFKTGLTSVATLENKTLFIGYSIIIWLLYFAMSYAVIKAFDETAHLGFSAVLSLFAIGTIAMAAPLPGGAGSYHVLIPAGLVLLYQVPEANAVAFTFVFHGWQTLILIVFGVISLILTSFRLRPKKVTVSEDQTLI
ncbi:MAG TPA: lysylphosphatidylglycerol synthase transmembrane domain-containing protein [Cyclobacteriaceae bacterium]|nr:lysylphosphatidylglycerol synthase transmembrane domain-containing protein [Cyclobacteriaceae bacterium]HRJ82670.1 lysylphosphatidylglycerol synthase transmembrane domain-containing protein [Cyclobacteriaceae bacterium]